MNRSQRSVRLRATSKKHLEVTSFAHPFGHKGPTTARLVGEAGLSTAADVGGYNRPVSPLSLGRTHLSNESVPGLFARMEVIEPIKEILRRKVLGAALAV